MNDEQQRIWARLTPEQRVHYAEGFLTPEQREAFRREAREYRRELWLPALRRAALIILWVVAVALFGKHPATLLPGLPW